MTILELYEEGEKGNGNARSRHARLTIGYLSSTEEAIDRLVSSRQALTHETFASREQSKTMFVAVTAGGWILAQTRCIEKSREIEERRRKANNENKMDIVKYHSSAFARQREASALIISRSICRRHG